MGASATGLTDKIKDLRRRKVFRATAAYGVVAWVSVEIASVIMPALELPDWTMRVIVLAAGTGFPLTIVLSWLFDITPEGVVRSPSAAELMGDDTEQGAAGASIARAVDFVIIGILVVLVVLVTWLWLRSAAVGADHVERPSIAVLPFQDLSEAGDSEYFADGIAEELLNSLARVGGLRVPSRTSSFAFKNSQEDIRTIAARLNVNTVLEGSVRRVGKDVRITAQLINAVDGFHLWSDTYDRRLDDIFAVQHEIAAAIVAALKDHLGAGSQLPSRMPADTAGVASIAAYDLYLLGRHHWHQRTPQSLTRAVELFKQAIAADPNYAPAYTGLADSYLLLVGYGDMQEDDAQRQAEPLIATALSLDPTLAEAYASQGLLRWQARDMAAAELALRSAVTRNPNYSMGQMWLGGVLADEQRLTDSLAAYIQAAAVDPLHPVINSNLAHTYAGMGRFDDAKAAALRVRQLQPGTELASMLAADIWARSGSIDQAVRYAREAVAEHPQSIKSHLMLAIYEALLGNFEAARAGLARADALGTPSPQLLMMRFPVLVLLGETAQFVEAANSLLADAGDWRTSALTEKQLMRLTWPGFARVLAGDYREGHDMLLRAVSQSKSKAMEPHDRVGVEFLLAYAAKQLGEPADIVQARLQNALTLGQEARNKGWGDPRLGVSMASVHAFLGNIDMAAAEMNAAVDAGWREYWSLQRMPGAAKFIEEPALAAILNRVRADLESMQASLLTG